jgi:hypothetical protein
METSLKQVVKHCSSEIDQFGICIERHPDSWQHDCEQQRIILFHCAMKQ